MDVAYNQHSHAARRKKRSSTNLHHLTLAPLTSKLPFDDGEDCAPEALSIHIPTSYLQGKSAPTTLRLLSCFPGPSRSQSRAHNTPPSTNQILQKSKSATQLLILPKTDTRHTSYTGRPLDPNETDWLLRAGALISTETRESKGQAWLVSRASSTSLTGLRDAEEEAYNRELAREREVTSRHASRRGSLSHVDDDRLSTPSHSRFASRAHSHIEIYTPQEQQHRRSTDGYFPRHDDDDFTSGPDFVNLDESLEAEDQDRMVQDEAHVRRLVKHGSVGMGTWFANMLGLQLFSVEENEEDSESEENGDESVTETEAEGIALSRTRSTVPRFERVNGPVEERLPPPKSDEGGWHDAAWLLSVASKVLL